MVFKRLMQIQFLRQYLDCDPLVQHPEGTTASIYLKLTNSRELLPSGSGAGLGSLNTTKMTPGFCGPSAIVKILVLSLWGWGQSPRHPECLWHCSGRWARWCYRWVKAVVSGFHKFIVVSAPGPVLGPLPLPKTGTKQGKSTPKNKYTPTETR